MNYSTMTNPESLTEVAYGERDSMIEFVEMSLPEIALSRTLRLTHTTMIRDSLDQQIIESMVEDAKRGLIQDLMTSLVNNNTIEFDVVDNRMGDVMVTANITLCKNRQRLMDEIKSTIVDLTNRFEE